MTSSSSRPQRLAIIAGVLLCLAAILFLHSGAPAAGDFGEWTYHGVLFRDVLTRHPDAGYLLKPYPVPNSLTTWVLGALMLVFPWLIAAKVFLLLEVALGLFAAWELSNCSGTPRILQLLWFASAAALGINFWAGFTNFMLGTFLAMLICARLLRGKVSFWPDALLLTLLFFSHMIPWGFAVLALILWARQNKRWSAIPHAVPSALLCLWYFVGRFTHANADGHADMVASVRYMTPLFAAFKVNTFLKNWGFINPATTDTNSVLLALSGREIFFLLLAFDLLLATAAAWMLSATAWKSIRERSPARFLWMAAAAFVLISLLMPGAAAGISDPGGRMMQVAIWSGLCLLTVNRRWLSGLLTACVAVLLAANLWLMNVAMMNPSARAADAGLPVRVRTFAHVYFTDRVSYPPAILDGQRDLPIYPTALFLRTAPKP